MQLHIIKVFSILKLWEVKIYLCNINTIKIFKLGENTLSKLNEDDHYCKAQAKYMMNYLTYVSNNFNDTALLLSMDDKSKVKIGVAAVSRFVHSRKYFYSDNGPKTLDHDFPISSKYLIIPSGKFFTNSF